MTTHLLGVAALLIVACAAGPFGGIPNADNFILSPSIAQLCSILNQGVCNVSTFPTSDAFRVVEYCTVKSSSTTSVSSCAAKADASGDACLLIFETTTTCPVSWTTYPMATLLFLSSGSGSVVGSIVNSSSSSSKTAIAVVVLILIIVIVIVGVCICRRKFGKSEGDGQQPQGQGPRRRRIIPSVSESGDRTSVQNVRRDPNVVYAVVPRPGESETVVRASPATVSAPREQPSAAAVSAPTTSGFVDWGTDASREMGEIDEAVRPAETSLFQQPQNPSVGPSATATKGEGIVSLDLLGY